MLEPSGIDDVSKEWNIINILEKREIISAFLNEYGEHATWEEWLYFLHQRQAKGFEWTQSVT